MIEAIVKYYDDSSKGFILFDGISMYFVSYEKSKSVNIKVGDKVLIQRKDSLTIGNKIIQLVNKVSKKL